MNMKSSFSLQKRFQFSLPSPNYLFPVTNHSCFRRTSLPSKPPKCVGLKATCSDEPKSNRTFKKMLPSPWTHHFHSVFVDVSEMDALRKEIDVVKTKVKNKVFSSGQGIDSTKERILMIYLLVSLGLAHYFEEEINETLKEGLEKMKEIMGGEKDLYTVSIIFWVFRTYGHYISSDVFRRFKGIDGNFKESLKGDAKGILSLYEASHMLTPTDHILEEALSFTSSHLEDLAAGGMCPTHLSMRIRNALTLSQRWNMEIITSMEYISSYYEQEKDHDEMLLRFAKLNFKLTQLHYLQDLKILTKWFKEQEFESKLPPYFKERIVENYFFVLALFFEPHLSHARIMCTQYFIIFGIIDDTFDRYASLPEAESLLNSIERWAPDHTMDKQPYYLKHVLKFILESVEEFGKELSPEVRSYSLKANIEEIKLIAKANFKILKWAHEGHVPSFERYMEFGLIEHTAYASFACFFMCMGNEATKEVYEWLKSRPKILESACIKLRLLNDIYGFEDDMSRGYTPNSVNCYMKQYGVTKEEAVRELLKMVADVEKAINEELLTTPHVVSSLFLNTATALSKMTTIAYNGYEGFTFLEGIINEYMTSLFLDQIRV